MKGMADRRIAKWKRRMALSCGWKEQYSFSPKTSN
jgi:hypothetical protein